MASSSACRRIATTRSHCREYRREIGRPQGRGEEARVRGLTGGFEDTRQHLGIAIQVALEGKQERGASPFVGDATDDISGACDQLLGGGGILARATDREPGTEIERDPRAGPVEHAFVGQKRGCDGSRGGVYADRRIGGDLKATARDAAADEQIRGTAVAHGDGRNLFADKAVRAAGGLSEQRANAHSVEQAGAARRPRAAAARRATR